MAIRTSLYDILKIACLDEYRRQVICNDDYRTNYKAEKSKDELTATLDENQKLLFDTFIREFTANEEYINYAVGEKILHYGITLGMDIREEFF